MVLVLIQLRQYLDCDGVCLNDADGDGVCDEVEVDGCTDSSACNYDDAATDDDDSCTYPAETYLDCDGECLNDSDGDGVCDELEIAGCIDENACNFNVLATDLDDSCTYPDEIYLDCDGECLSDSDGDGVCDELEVPGCQDETACNYNENATDSGECDFTSCVGCMDITACNYNENYTIEDNDTCTFPVDIFGFTYLDCNGECLNDTDGDGVCDENEIVGCTDSSACNYDNTATDDDGTCTFVDGICDICENGIIVDNDIDNDGICDSEDICPNDFNNDADNDGICESDEIAGCQDATACNYNENATDDDDSCIFVDGICETCSGETDGTGTIVDNDADDDGVCDADEIAGCQDATACNYNENATDDDDSCIFVDGICETCSGETDGTGTIVDNDADDDGVCDADEIAGCQDATACNYNENATDDDDSCIFVDGICETCSGETDGTGTIVDNDADDDGVCDADEIAGCQDATACNYNENATDDDGSCIFVDGICETCSGETDGTGTIVDNDADDDGVCDADEIAGCQDATACNYNENATDDDGSCIFVDGICETCSGETDGTGTIVDNDADDDGVCDADEIAGCQDATACNYNENATDDDGSCIFVDGICETCSGETDGTGTIVDNDADDDGVCDADEIADVKMQQHVTITRTQQMMMVLVFLLMVFVRLVQVR